MKKIVIRWSVFLLCLLGIVVFVDVKVHSIARANVQSAVIVNMPAFSKEILTKDVSARMKYLSSRVKGTKFYIHKVKSRENLWTIAKKNGYSVHTIIGCNPQLKTYDVYINQEILIPSSGGSLHPVQSNDTWPAIAEKYDIDETVLRRANFAVTADLSGEDFIFIPGKRPAVDLLNESMQEKYALRNLFTWPLASAGRLSSSFGRRRHPVTGQISRHGGIDIATKYGSPVVSAMSGVVSVASYDVGHYGVAVFIDHQNGYITHYGHLDKILVRMGQKVKAGQLIARSGSSGRSTGPHLHFTIKKNGVNIDPLKFLW